MKILFTPTNSTDKKHYQIDLDKKIIYPYDQFSDNTNSENFAEYNGIPKEEKSPTVNKEINLYLSSLDKTKFLVNYIITDLTSTVSDYDGSQTVLSLTKYICDKSNKTCVLSDLINKANSWNNKLGLPPIEWDWWNSNKKILFGSPIFNQNVAMYDYQNNIYKSIKPEGDKFYCVSANPTMDKIITCEDNKITLYDNFLNKVRQYVISLKSTNIIKSNYERESIDRVIWSPNEKTIYVVTTNHSVYSLDLMSGISTLVYQNNQQPYSSYNLYNIELSSNGKYLVIVDYELKDAGTYKVKHDGLFNGKTLVLKVVNLQQNNKISEIMRGDEIWIR
jgi:hypothetical protein